MLHGITGAKRRPDSSVPLKREEEVDPIASALAKISKTNSPYTQHDTPPASLFSFLAKKVKCLTDPQTDATTFRRNITNFFSTVLRKSIAAGEIPTPSALKKLFQEEILKTTTIPTRILAARELYLDQPKYDLLGQFEGIVNLKAFWKVYSDLSPRDQETLQSVVGDKKTLGILKFYQDEENLEAKISMWLETAQLIQDFEDNKIPFEKEFAAKFPHIDEAQIRRSFTPLWHKHGSTDSILLNTIPLRLPDLTKKPDKEAKDAFLEWLVFALENSNSTKKLERLSGHWALPPKEGGSVKTKKPKNVVPTNTLLRFLSINGFSPVTIFLNELFPEFFSAESIRNEKPLWKQNKEIRARYMILILPKKSQVIQIRGYKLIIMKGLEEILLGSMRVHWRMCCDGEGNPTNAELSFKKLTFTPEADLETRLAVLKKMQPKGKEE